MGRAQLHPAQVLVSLFAAGLAVATGLLMLPAASASGESTGFVDALFHATTSLCVTGLASLDTGTHWSTFGLVVLVACMQIGGIGIMTSATALALLVTRRLRVRTRLYAAAETQTVGLGDLRRILRGVLTVTLSVEAVTAVALAARWWVAYDMSPVEALGEGVFHAVSAFNNAGLGLRSDSMVPYATDAWILIPITVAVVIGGLGFPVLLELRREFGRSVRWSLTTRMVVWTSVALLLGGGVFVTASEWSNPHTLGQLSPAQRVLSGFFQAAMTRSAGFNSIDLASMDPATWFGMDLLMFIGSGPTGTGGGIKVTTFAVLVAVVVSEVRGHESVHAFGARIAPAAIRLSVTVAALSAFVVAVGTLALLWTDGVGLDRTLLEVVSAFGTVGLSANVTPTLSDGGKLVLVALMFAGRLGPVTLASALALRSSSRRYEYAEERPLIG